MYAKYAHRPLSPQNTDVELRRRITNAKRTPADDLTAIHRRTQGVSSNAGYVPQNP